MYHKIRQAFKVLLYMFLSIDIFKIMKDILYMAAFSYFFGLIAVLQLQDTFTLLTIETYESGFFLFFLSLKCTLEVLRYITMEEYSGWFTKKKTASDTTSVLADMPFAKLEKLAKDNVSKGKIADTKNYRLNSVHEAGHVVAAYLLDVNVDYVKISSLNGSTCFNASFNINFVDNLKKAILIDYAGSIAERMILGCVGCGNYGTFTADFEKAREEIKRYLAQQDFQQNNDISHIFTFLYSDLNDLQNNEYLKSIKRTEQQFYQEATKLLENQHSLIEAVATALEEKHYLDSNTIYHILKTHVEHTIKEGITL